MSISRGWFITSKPKHECKAIEITFSENFCGTYKIDLETGESGFESEAGYVGNIITKVTMES